MAKLGEVTREVEKLKAAYPSAGVLPQTVAIYAEMLADLEPAALASAIAGCISTCRFFPTIAEIRRAAAEEEVGRLPSPEEALLAIRQAIRSGRSAGHPLLDSIISRYGREKLEDRIDDRLVRDIYTALREKIVRGHVELPALEPGGHEAWRAGPVRIGECLKLPVPPHIAARD